MDVAILLIASGMVHQERFQNLTNFAQAVVEKLDVGQSTTRVALLTWNDRTQVVFNLKQYYNKYDVMQAIRLLPSFQGGATNTSGALRTLRREIFTQDNGDRPNVPNVVIIVTNGPSTVDVGLTIPEAVQCRLNGYLIIPIALESQMSSSLEMEAIASHPRETTLFKVNYFRDLPNFVQPVVDRTCNSGRKCSSSPCRNGGTCTDDYQSYICACTSGFSGISCQRSCNKPMDVLFVIDISGSTEDEYRNNLLLARNVTQGLDIRNDVHRTGAIAFATNVVGQFFFDQTIGSQSAAVNLLDFYNTLGTTNTPAALEAVLSTQLNTRGDRPDVPNVVIVMTDGMSNVNQQNTIPLAVRIKATGAKVVVVAVGPTPNMDELRGMVSPPTTENIFYLTTATRPDDVATDILNKLCAA